MRATGAILVGGKARRFGGQPKPALRIGDQTIHERQLDAMKEAGVAEVLVVGQRSGAYGGGGRRLPDLVPDGGPMGGVYSALLAATSPVVVVVAGDMPFVTAALIRALAGMPTNVDAHVARTDDGRHPVCAAYRRGLALRIKSRLDRGALKMTEALEDWRVQDLAPGEWLGRGWDMLLMNVNTPDDYQRAVRHARATR
ncbi:MAG: molybdenum cofactor guanylyltransferase [Acidobacteriota bacterium]